ncbi:MAG: fatty acid oxidation complex subunit alpha FadJ [Balneolales bacterium]
MKNFSIDQKEGLAIITLDQPGEKVNKLTAEILGEFKECIQNIEGDKSIRAVILISGKKDNFIAGADIRIFSTFKQRGDAEKFSREGNEFLSRIANLSKPVVAAIHGSCMGGGLEVALACHYRIASVESQTKFSFPEVNLGLLPGAGGTQRLPRLIGIPKALDMMLTGKSVFPRQALKMGLVDEIIHQKGLLEAAKTQARSMAGSKPHPVKKKQSLVESLLEMTASGRKMIYSKARNKVIAKTYGHYPAPFKIIQCVRSGMEKGMKAGLEEESRQFDHLAFSPESKMMVGLFFAMQEAKKNPWPSKVQKTGKVGVLGAGLMGSGITDVTVQAGLPVVLKDRDLATAGKGLKGLWKGYEKKVAKKIISPFERDRLIGMITPADDYSEFNKIDLVIEAVFEDLKLKQSLLAEVENAIPKQGIFASNTSSLPISEIAKKAKRPANILGMHYFSPVQKMPLLEIVRTKKTSEQALATAYDVGLKQKKTVIVVSDGPGFYTTRILAPYMNEAMLLLEEGIKIEDLDRSMKEFGFPVGPAVLMDEVGLDVGAHIAEIMSGLFAKRKHGTSTSAKTLVDAGFKGRKNKMGFYLYEEGLFKRKNKEVNEDVYQYIGGKARKDFEANEVQERMVLTMINEAAHCLSEGIVASPQDADLGAVLGLGFPPFLGGPFHYIDQIGPAVILEKLHTYGRKHGNRFDAAPILKDYGKKNRKFYE